MTHQSSPIIHQSSKICPYPGLRAFEEEEALYFKGRERPIDDIMEKLAANKFLLLTGASGDGKSSLIFAGLVPNCRAGFFKAKFNNWAIVSFRPERTPLRNLAAALAPHLVNSAESEQSSSSAESVIENSLKYGYAALIDLYKESSLFIDTNGAEWSNVGDEEQRKMKHNASNLLIIVDQFEELFTNPENFNRETSTATESTQVMGSLLLETASLAREQDIPIYIVCTMRSDYLGQCAALSGFPEKIEKCLFYLPRLKRQDIVQVIEEPAMLSGNSISERLIQRLLNDTHAGIDILPVLQHCLHRIWLAADKGNEQMDIIHYAMVGGMTGEQLPKEYRERFENWFGSLSGYKRALFSTASLGNVLNIHANELYLTAGQTSTDSEGDMTKSDARFIIETTFKCLTKIDDNRAIRNLMTIDEITEMLGKDKYTIDQVAEVIKPFRIHGNTFIRPFITDEISTIPPLADKQQPSTVLDITHEALIRNWKRLDDWAWEEHQNVQTYREFRAQLDKWLKNNRKKEHLMSIGSLNYFGTWFKAQKTNPLTWLKRYMWKNEEDEGTDKPAIVKKERQEISRDSSPLPLGKGPGDELVGLHFANIREYLNLSRKNIARKTRLTRIAVAAICVLLVGVSIAFFNAQNLKNKITTTDHANQIATKAYLQLENDPTLAFRLAEQAYYKTPTRLSKQVLMHAYTNPIFYKIFKGHTSSVRTAIFSPDGNYILSASDDYTVRLWNIQGKQITVLKNTVAPINYPTHDEIDFSPDGKMIATACIDNIAKIWDLDGNCLQTFKGHSGNVISAQFSPDGKFLLTASFDKTAMLWDIKGNRLQTLKGHLSPLRLARFSPNGKYIITVSDENIARVWDTYGNIKCILKGHKSRVYDGNFSHDSQYIVTSSYDNTIILWNLKGNKLNVMEGHDNWVWTAKFSPDDKYIITSSIDNTARVWNRLGKPIHILRGHKAKLWEANFSPDGKHIITIADDLIGRLWDVKGNLIAILRGHTGQMYTANFSPDGKYLVTTSFDNTIRLWNIKPEENPVLQGHKGWVIDANFSPDGKYIVTAAFDQTARIWDMTGKELKVFRGHDHYGVETAKFLHDGKTIITGSADKTARLWNLDGDQLQIFKSGTGRIEKVYFSNDGNHFLTWGDGLISKLWDKNGSELKVFTNVNGVDLTNDGKYIVTASSDSNAYIYQRKKTGTKDTVLLYQKLSEHNAAVDIVRISPDDNFIITGTSNFDLYIWDFRNKKNQKTRLIKLMKGHTGKLWSINFSQDSKYFVSSSDDATARVWDMQGNQITVLLGHSNRINDASFSHDGKYITTGSLDLTARVWNMDGDMLQILPGHTAMINTVKFSKDGKYLLTASDDNTARLMPWRVEDVLHKINVEKVRGEVWQLSEEDKKLYGIIE